MSAQLSGIRVKSGGSSKMSVIMGIKGKIEELEGRAGVVGGLGGGRLWEWVWER